MKTSILHLRRTNCEKEDEVRCKRDEVERKEKQLEDEDDRLRRSEEELDDETSCTTYCINELKKKIANLNLKHEEIK